RPLPPRALRCGNCWMAGWPAFRPPRRLRCRESIGARDGSTSSTSRPNPGSSSSATRMARWRSFPMPSATGRERWSWTRARAVAAGLVARLWLPPRIGSQQATAHQRLALVDGGPRQRAMKWFVGVDRGLRARMELEAVIEAQSLVEELPVLADLVAREDGDAA